MSLVDTATEIIGDLAGPYVLLTSASRSIGGIIPGITIREVLVDENTITVHPVQSGAPISDHVFANPSIIEMVLGWSDSTGGYPGYVLDVYQTLLALRDTREPFDVSTGKRQYSNMLFGNITVPTDEYSEFTLMRTIRLQEVIIASTDGGGGATIDNQANPQQTGPEQNVGTQSLQSTGTESETAASARAGVTVPNTNVGDAIGTPGQSVG